MKRIVLGLQYEGRQWQGWQTQPHGDTVQDELESALTKFTQMPLDTVCAGRTDAGVHAIGQVVHFDTTLDRKLYSWISGVNAFLPQSIAVQWAHEVPLDLNSDSNFHARFSAYARTYRYVLVNRSIRSPMWAGRAGWYFRPLDVSKMQEAASYLLGTHDFTVFRAAACQAKSPIKTMYSIEIERQGEFIVFSLKANAFLHHMVRNIMGSLLFVGSGRRDPKWIAELIMSRDRGLAAPTFMPDGLYLVEIDYDPKWGLPVKDVIHTTWGGD